MLNAVEKIKELSGSVLAWTAPVNRLGEKDFDKLYHKAFDDFFTEQLVYLVENDAFQHLLTEDTALARAYVYKHWSRGYSIKKIQELVKADVTRYME